MFFFMEVFPSLLIVATGSFSARVMFTARKYHLMEYYATSRADFSYFYEFSFSNQRTVRDVDD